MEGEGYDGDMNFNRFAENVLVIVTAFVIIAVGTYIVLKHRGLDWKTQYKSKNDDNGKSV